MIIKKGSALAKKCEVVISEKILPSSMPGEPIMKGPGKARYFVDGKEVSGWEITKKGNIKIIPWK